MWWCASWGPPNWFYFDTYICVSLNASLHCCGVCVCVHMCVHIVVVWVVCVSVSEVVVCMCAHIYSSCVCDNMWCVCLWSVGGIYCSGAHLTHMERRECALKALWKALCVYIHCLFVILSQRAQEQQQFWSHCWPFLSGPHRLSTI